MTARQRATRGLRVAGTVPVISGGASYVRRAREADVPAIVSIIDTYVERKLLLKRTPEEVLANLDSWRVAELDGAVVGCAALTDFGEGLGELRSLSVREEAYGRGLGDLLVRQIVRDAQRAGINRLFVITKIPRYFARHGFVSLEMDEVPEVLAVDRVPWPRKPGEGHAMELPL
jgi:N-acetylglutamate synthase-like GNAT family acetyltransferase